MTDWSAVHSPKFGFGVLSPDGTCVGLNGKSWESDDVELIQGPRLELVYIDCDSRKAIGHASVLDRVIRIRHKQKILITRIRGFAFVRTEKL